MNRLDQSHRALILRCLCEGMGVRPTCRVAGCFPNTVMKLFLEAGEWCQQFHDEQVRNLHTKRVQMDELWAFVGAKKHKCTASHRAKGWGDSWSWFAIDADARLIISYLVSDRSKQSAFAIAHDMRSRIVSMDVDVSTDQLASYGPALLYAFAGEPDECQLHHASVTKVFGRQDLSYDGRFSPSVMKAVKKEVACGAPDMSRANTSYSERFNLTLRMQNRRFTRCTNGHSKKLHNMRLSVALSTWHYNFVRPHASLGGLTPAQFAGIAAAPMTMRDLIESLPSTKNTCAPLNSK